MGVLRALEILVPAASPYVMACVIGALLAIFLFALFPRKKLRPPPMSSPSSRGVQRYLRLTAEELKQYDGRDETKPIFVAIKGVIYDVTPSRQFYGPGGPYENFAGREAARGLAKMSFSNPEDVTDKLDDLTAQEKDTLLEWQERFDGKYAKAGVVVTAEEKAKILKEKEVSEVVNETSQESQGKEEKGAAAKST